MEKLKPNFTQTPNVFFDEIMPTLGYAELKCLLYIFRRTYGFHKQSDKISLSQFVNGIEGLDKGTGLAKKNVYPALESLVEKKLVKKDTSGSTTRYSLYLSEPTEVGTQSTQTRYVKYPEVGTQSTLQKKEKESIQKKEYASKLADPLSLSDFVTKCKTSTSRHIQIIGEWAEGEQPRHTTQGEWDSFLKRNLRIAKELSVYPIEKIEKAYQLLQKDIVRKLPNGKQVGFITRYSLETVLKYIDKV